MRYLKWCPCALIEGNLAGRVLEKHCKDILEQNLLKSGETLLVATAHEYELELVSGFLSAASEIGATGGHLAIIPKISEREFVGGLTKWHWDLYASADLLITITQYPNHDRLPRPSSDYIEKTGDHPFRTDYEFINRPGSRTRWLDLMMPVPLQRIYFPRRERAELSLKGAKIVERAKEISVTNPAGTDLVAKKSGRPGHAQYGIADSPGRWDNFGYACVGTAPEEFSAEGKVVIQPGDIIPDLHPYPIILDPITLKFNGGYVTSIEGGLSAKLFRRLLSSFEDKESYGTSHTGFGLHERATLGHGTGEEIDAFHHNYRGSILFSLGMNYGHGLGGAETRYSGLGPGTRKANSHTHFTLFDSSFYCDDELIVNEGRLLL